MCKYALVFHCTRIIVRRTALTVLGLFYLVRFLFGVHCARFSRITARYQFAVLFRQIISTRLGLFQQLSHSGYFLIDRIRVRHRLRHVPVHTHNSELFTISVSVNTFPYSLIGKFATGFSYRSMKIPVNLFSTPVVSRYLRNRSFCTHEYVFFIIKKNRRNDSTVCGRRAHIVL